MNDDLRMDETVMFLPTSPETYVLGSKLSLCSLDTIFQMLKIWIETQHAATILYGNLHSLNLAYEQPWLRHFLNAADVVHLDGEGARWAAIIALYHNNQSTVTVPARSTWADLGWQLAEFCAQHQMSLYLLGGAPGVAQRAADALQTQYPTLKIVGTQHGYFDMKVGSSANEAVLAQIWAAQPHILVVGFGMPLQERWLLHNRAHLPPCVCWGAGAAFDYLSGSLPRGPQWMTDNGLEWLSRLLIQPHRLWRRYLIGLPLFWIRFLRELMIPRKRRCVGY